MRGRTGAFALATVVLLAACSGGSGESRATPTGDAVTVDGTTISAAELVDELTIIAENDELAAVLADDDIELVPEDGTISPSLSATWVNQRVNQIIIDGEFERLGLNITAELAEEAKDNAATLFRGPKVFAAFPREFRDLVIARQERTEAVEAEFPATAEPTDAELTELLEQSKALCEGDKLIAQIVVTSRAEADAIVADLAAGRDFAELAGERSLDQGSAANGGGVACVGSTRYAALAPAVRDAAERLPVGATSEPLESETSFTVLRILAFTLDTARPLLVEAWDNEHLSPFGDAVEELVKAADIDIARRFALLVDGGSAVGIFPPEEPVRL